MMDMRLGSSWKLEDVESAIRSFYRALDLKWGRETSATRSQADMERLAHAVCGRIGVIWTPEKTTLIARYVEGTNAFSEMAEGAPHGTEAK